jgi:hypothetical protein
MGKLFNNTVSRSDVMRRAWELARMNRKSANVKVRMTAKWLKMAWSEARTGETQAWLWLNDANMLAHLDARYDATILNQRTGENRSELFAQIAALRAKVAPAAEAMKLAA